VVFENQLDLTNLKLVLGAPDRPKDYMRKGALEIASLLAPAQAMGADKPKCRDYKELAIFSQREVSWQGYVPQVRCLRVRLLEPQQEWVMIRFKEVTQASARQAVSTSLTTLASSEPPPPLPASALRASPP
ncbi:unnamed protein product, partial [Effrenium voratum]